MTQERGDERRVWLRLEVLREPAECVAVTLLLDDGAHEELEWTAGEARLWDGALARGLAHEAQGSAELFLARSARDVNLVAEHNNGDV